jgi:hypothetical protein
VEDGALADVPFSVRVSFLSLKANWTSEGRHAKIPFNAPPSWPAKDKMMVRVETARQEAAHIEEFDYGGPSHVPMCNLRLRGSVGQ